MFKVTIYEKYYDPDDVVDGEIGESYTNEDVNVYDPRWDDDVTPTVWAAEILIDKGLTAPSVAPGFYRNIWYGYVDGSFTSDYYTGECCQSSGHIDGFTVEQQYEIWKLVTGQAIKA